MVPLNKLAGIMLLTSLSQPAMASIIIETYSFSGSNKINGSTIAGLAFNGQLGTLTYASATFDGTYTPRRFTGSERDQARAVNLQFTLGFPLSSTSLPESDRGIYNLALRATEYLTGTAQSFDASENELPENRPARVQPSVLKTGTGVS